jgi:hypothetical protein
MGRTQSSQISQTSENNAQQDQGNAQGALAATNKALTDYSSNLSKYMDTGRATYGQSGEFAADQNTIGSTTAAAGTKSVAGDLALNSMRTGQNTAGYAPAVATAKSNAEQNLTSQLATADQSRLSNLNAVNQFGVTASALPAQVQAGMYGTSLGGSNSAMGTASSASTASPGFLDVFGQDLAAGAGAAAGAAAKGCWIAAAVFGENFETGTKTNLVRSWLWDIWGRHWYAKPILWLYTKFGERAARSTTVVRLLAPLFNLALREAIQ